MNNKEPMMADKDLARDGSGIDSKGPMAEYCTDLLYHQGIIALFLLQYIKECLRQVDPQIKN